MLECWLNVYDMELTSKTYTKGKTNGAAEDIEILGGEEQTL